MVALKIRGKDPKVYQCPPEMHHFEGEFGLPPCCQPLETSQHLTTCCKSMAPSADAWPSILSSTIAGLGAVRAMQRRGGQNAMLSWLRLSR